jgi:hypothetical protein
LSHHGFLHFGQAFIALKSNQTGESGGQLAKAFV